MVLILSLLGPWGIFEVTSNTQLLRLEQILLSHDILVDGKIRKTSTELDCSNVEELTWLVDYFQPYHDYPVLEKFYTPEDWQPIVAGI